MPLEAATYIEDLNASNPPGSDQLKQADDHIRLIKAALKATFPTLSAPRYLEQPRADVADSATPALWAATTNYANLLGTTTITGFASGISGQQKIVRFDGARQLTHHATTLNLPGAANITTVAGDHALIACTGTTGNIVLAYFRASGRALIENTPPTTASETVEGLVEQATSAEIYASTAGAKALMAEDLATGADYITIADAAPVAPNWAAFINGILTLAGNRTINVPTNLKPGVTRIIWIQGNDGTDRTITLGAGYLGPNVAIWNALTFNSSNKRYLMPLIALNSSNAVFVGAPQGPF